VSEPSTPHQTRDRAGDHIRGEALRLALTGDYADIASVTAVLVEAGFAGVEDAIAGWVMLASLCRHAASRKAAGLEVRAQMAPGLLGLFIDPSKRPASTPAVE